MLTVCSNVKTLNCGTIEEQIHVDNMNTWLHVYSDGLSTLVEDKKGQGMYNVSPCALRLH